MSNQQDRRSFIGLGLGAALAALAPAARAQAAYPDKPLKLTVGFAAGTGPDVLARTVGEALAQSVRQSVVVDNRTGAGGQIAAAAIAHSAADGYNLLLADVAAISIAPAAFTRLTYDPLKELVPVTEVARTDFVLVVPASAPGRTVAEFVQAGKGSARELNFGTFGAGTPGHFGAIMFAEMAGFKVQPIHFRQTADVVTALGAGEVQAVLMSTPLAAAQVKGGRMRALATTAAQRSALMPEVPTFAEAGYPKADFSAWFCIFVPTGTPQAVIDTVQQHAARTVQSAETRKKLEDAGFTVVGSTEAEARKLVRDEAARWERVVKASGFRGD